MLKYHHCGHCVLAQSRGHTGTSLSKLSDLRAENTDGGSMVDTHIHLDL